MNKLILLSATFLIASFVNARGNRSYTAKDSAAVKISTATVFWNLPILEIDGFGASNALHTAQNLMIFPEPQRSQIPDLLLLQDKGAKVTSAYLWGTSKTESLVTLPEINITYNTLKTTLSSVSVTTFVIDVNPTTEK